MRTLCTVLVLVALLGPGGAVATAGAPSGDAAVAAVERLEPERRRAMVDFDAHRLARILADDVTYVHSTGLVQSRDDLMGMLAKGDIRYVSFQIESVAYRAYGSTVVGTGVQTIELTNSGKPFTSRSRYTVVYAVVRGEHRLVSYQATTMPEIVMQEKKGDRKAP